MKLVLALALLISWNAKADQFLHDMIEKCAVTSDATCLRNILHHLVHLGGGSSVAVSLSPGNYTKVGSSSFCPQNIGITSAGSGLGLKVTYLSPCNLSETFTCVGSHCENQDKGRTLDVLSSTSYYFKEGSTEDTFRRDGTVLEPLARQTPSPVLMP